MMRTDERSHRRRDQSSGRRNDRPSRRAPADALPAKKPRTTLEEVNEDNNSSGASAASVVDDPLALDRFRFSDSVKRLLASKGIKTLFPIQAQTFDLVLDGCDVVGRAKTGSGKTLAFVLPIVERLIKNDRSRPLGRGPSVLCLTPTRELAKQVCSECEYIGRAGNLISCCIYGSSPYYEQERALRRGADILVGTPGRIKDHINRGTLDLTNLKYQVLDECDQMLQMGFVDDVEFILNAVGSREHIQTLLFSATLPPWVRSLLAKFCKADYRTIDLVTAQSSQATNSVEHKCVMTERFAEMTIVPDLIQCHANGGRTIVFVETKANCDRTAESLAKSHRARAIHGDLQQKMRETTLDSFRRGQIDVLVATDVAARGLDIPEVNLVIQMSPPKDVESYIHRAGRTGRAEKTGVCICIVTRATEHLLKRLQHAGRIRFRWIEAPQTADMIQVATCKAEQTLKEVKPHRAQLFLDSAQQLLRTWEDPTRLVAAALAYITGHAKLQQKSLLTRQEDHVTLQIHCDKRDRLTEEKVVQEIKRRLPNVQPKGVRMVHDGSGAVFDVHEDSVAEFLKAFPKDASTPAQVLTSLPSLRFIAMPQENDRYQNPTRPNNNHQQRQYGGDRHHPKQNNNNNHHQRHHQNNNNNNNNFGNHHSGRPAGGYNGGNGRSNNDRRRYGHSDRMGGYGNGGGGGGGGMNRRPY